MKILAIVFMMMLVACAGTALVSIPTYICPTAIPLPTVTTLAGTPPPTSVPPATPYVITPPQDFYMGDAVIIGSVGAALRVQLRLQNVLITPLSSVEQVVAWELEVANIGTDPYEILPSVQLYVSDINGTVGIWGATQAAGDLVSIIIDSDLYQLNAGETRTFQLAALTPRGDDLRFSFQLDPTQGTNSPIMTWINVVNPYCDSP